MTHTLPFGFAGSMLPQEHKTWVIIAKQFKDETTNQHVGGWLEVLWYLQPIRVQILVLAFIPGFISRFPVMRIQWEETFPSTTRCLALVFVLMFKTKLKAETTGQCRIPLYSHIKDTYSLRLSFHIPWYVPICQRVGKVPAQNQVHYEHPYS